MSEKDAKTLAEMKETLESLTVDLEVIANCSSEDISDVRKRAKECLQVARKVLDEAKGD